MNRYAVIALTLHTALGFAAQPAPSFQSQHEAWRTLRLAALTRPEGWLSVVGLTWLSPGVNTLGSGKEAALTLPAKAPARVGTLTWKEGKVYFLAAPGVVPTRNGQPFRSGVLEPDTPASWLALGDLRLGVIARGDRMGLRVRDVHSEARQDFKGIPAFAPDPAWRLEARYEPFEKPKQVRIATVIGTPMDAEIPGRVTFTLAGQTLTLEPVLEDGQFFFIFRDTTSGEETYPAGRFLYADLPRDGKVILDFNRAENPPCAFTLFATCPLAPPQNALPVAVKAGEKDPHLH